MGVFTAISAAISVGSAVQSFSQAAKQNNLQEKAEKEAEKSVAEAKKKLSVNYAEGLSIQKEPYELEREALISAGAQALQAGVEGDVRGAGALAGRVQAAQQAGQRQIAAAMGQDMLGLEKAAAAEDARIAQDLSSIDLMEAQGAQQAAKDAERRRNAAIQQGVVSATKFGEIALEELVPLYREQKQEANSAGLNQNGNATGGGVFDILNNKNQAGSITSSSGMSMEEIQKLVDAGIITLNKPI